MDNEKQIDDMRNNRKKGLVIMNFYSKDYKKLWKIVECGEDVLCFVNKPWKKDRSVRIKYPAHIFRFNDGAVCSALGEEFFSTGDALFDWSGTEEELFIFFCKEYDIEFPVSYLFALEKTNKDKE